MTPEEIIENAEVADARTTVEGFLAAASGSEARAFLLTSTVPDYEAAAIDAGWSRIEHSGWFNGPVGGPVRLADYDDWEELCDNHDIAPLEAAIVDFRSVSDWLADELDAEGERVVRDVTGLNVWCRTSSVDPADDRTLAAIANRNVSAPRP